MVGGECGERRRGGEGSRCGCEWLVGGRYRMDVWCCMGGVEKRDEKRDEKWLV